MKARLVACALALMCAVGGASRTNAAAAGGHDVSLTSLENGRWGLWSHPALLGAASECEWQTEMDQLASQGGLIVASTPRAPSVDWSRQMVVLVALGEWDGWSVEVTHASRDGRTLVLDVTLTEGTPSGDMNVSPYDLVALDARGLDQVQARYNLAPPGMPASQVLTGCGASLTIHGVHPSANGALQMAGGPVSWGALKLRYR